MLVQRRVTLDKVETITAFAEDMSEFLKTSQLTESRAFIRSFVKEISVRPGRATIHYSIPTPEDNSIAGRDAAEIALKARRPGCVQRAGGPVSDPGIQPGAEDARGRGAGCRRHPGEPSPWRPWRRTPGRFPTQARSPRRSRLSALSLRPRFNGAWNRCTATNGWPWC